MSLATSMKDLVEDVQSSTNERHEFVGNIVKDVKALLSRFDREQQDIKKELKELAEEIKRFLARSENARKEDFGAMMKDITERLNEISKCQKDVRKDARELVREYAADHKKAREYRLSLNEHRKPGRPPKKEEKEEKEQ